MFLRLVNRRVLSTASQPPPHWRPSAPEVTTLDRIQDAIWKASVIVLVSSTIALASYSSLGLTTLSVQRYLYGQRIKETQEAKAAEEAAQKAKNDFVVK